MTDRLLMLIKRERYADVFFGIASGLTKRNQENDRMPRSEKECIMYNGVFKKKVWEMQVKKRTGFTLIELLVVISIIALLLSILMPALSRAKEQARLVICMANSKQIGSMTAAYQSDNDNRVPILFNQGSYQWVPAKTCFLSLALRNYFPDAKTLPPSMDPEKRNWSGALVAEYKSTYIPDVFVCPYVRVGGKNRMEGAGQVELEGPGGKKTFSLGEMKGRSESYSAWLHPKAHIDQALQTSPHPFGLPDGMPKYSLLRWFNDDAVSPEPPGPGPLLGYKWVTSVKWLTGTDRGKRVGNFSSCTVLYCNQGEWSSWYDTIVNYKKHRKGASGGTNAIFGDTHVEWVPGTQIGWP